MLHTMKMVKMTMWRVCLRSELARRIGRMSTMAAPVVPMTFARIAPTNRKATLVRGVPSRLPVR